MERNEERTVLHFCVGSIATQKPTMGIVRRMKRQNVELVSVASQLPPPEIALGTPPPRALGAGNTGATTGGKESSLMLLNF